MSFKHKLGEKQAWGMSLVAKGTQGQLVALTHNLLLIYETRRERKPGVTNTAEDDRRQERVRESSVRFHGSAHSMVRTFASASSSLLASLPPPRALSGLPPPLPPTMGAMAWMIFPA